MTRLALLATAATMAAWPSFAADSVALLAPTPLVLKDGRIAQVTVHSIPFPMGKDELDEPAQGALTTLVEELATDCFLTAQAVGHVEPGPGSDGETLAAHRLARARADRVQAALTGRGLPARSVASVWDWQFAVREPRVTLWVFRLAEGDDCDSRPIARLESPASVDAAMTAATTAPETPAVEETTTPARPEIIVDKMPGAESEGSTVVAEAMPEPTLEPKPPTPALDEVPATKAMPEETPVGATAEVPAIVVIPQPAPTVAAPEAQPPAEKATLGTTLAVSFDINSSYFRKMVSRDLETLVDGLAPYRGYEVLLEGSVSAEALRNRPPEEGQAYNRWIADRRMERVADWLRRKLNGSVSITQTYVENDNSRSVTITVKPVS